MSLWYLSRYREAGLLRITYIVGLINQKNRICRKLIHKQRRCRPKKLKVCEWVSLWYLSRYREAGLLRITYVVGLINQKNRICRKLIHKQRRCRPKKLNVCEWVSLWYLSHHRETWLLIITKVVGLINQKNRICRKLHLKWKKNWM